jgi:ubiquinone/menaquinone biosynthesis C-methylase UbiE
MPERDEQHYVPALGYHWLTPHYDRIVALTTRERTVKAALLRQARISAGQRVLDLACGTGTLAIRIKQSVPDATVVGVDADPEVLALAARKAEAAGVAIQLDQAMSFTLPYADADFDRVLSSLFFHHLSWEDKLRTAHELVRVLRPGGEVHIADWGQAANAVMRMLFVPIQLLDGVANTRDNVTGRLTSMLEQVGLANVSEATRVSTAFGTMALYRATKRW